MRGQSLPLIGMVLFMGVTFGWRPWLQRRRHGTSGILFLRSGDWRQRVRDALGIVLFTCLLGQAIVAAARPESPSLLHGSVGSIVMFGGLVLLVIAQLDLGASWRIGIDEGTRTGLVTTGFYRFCRNPIYLAIIVLFTGYTILLPTRFSLLLLLGYFIGMRQQTLSEEAYLLRRHGDAYRDYARRVGRFLPGIGRLSRDASATTIRPCGAADLPVLFSIINDAAQAYKGVIPADCWHEPYMPLDELKQGIRDGIAFWGYESGGELVGVMGIQDRGEVSLIRHAYVRTAQRRKGIGEKLLKHLEGMTAKPILIGTWSAAAWAVRFYEKNGYRALSRPETERLLRKYWSITERQVETSVVLANARWKS